MGEEGERASPAKAEQTQETTATRASAGRSKLSPVSANTAAWAGAALANAQRRRLRSLAGHGGSGWRVHPAQRVLHVRLLGTRYAVQQTLCHCQLNLNWNAFCLRKNGLPFGTHLA